MPTQDSDETRTILVSRGGSEPDFKITIPLNAKTTFAPFSPPSKDHGYQTADRSPIGTLRIYRTEKDIIAVFSNVTGFRDIDMDYTEGIITVQNETSVWRDSKGNYETTGGATVEESGNHQR